jgi:hypothetical protein
VSLLVRRRIAVRLAALAELEIAERGRRRTERNLAEARHSRFPEQEKVLALESDALLGSK